MSHRDLTPIEEVKCGDVTVDVALDVSVAAYKAAIQEIGATICEVASRQKAALEATAGDLRTYSDAADQAVLNVIDALSTRIDNLPAATGGADVPAILAQAKADAAAVVAEALKVSPQAAQELQILLTLVQEAPELRNIAGVIARLGDVETRVKALEDTKFTVEDVDCRAISVVVKLTDRLSDAMKNFRLDVMNCAYPVAQSPATAA